MPLTRLDAEALYDALLSVSGRLDRRPFGPADPVESRADGLVTPAGTSSGWRRLIYVQHLRKKVLTHMENFDFPQMNPNCVERRDSLAAPQALHLMNNGMVMTLADHFAARVLHAAGNDPAQQVDHASWLAFGRAPNELERQAGQDALRQLTEDWTATLAATGTTDHQPPHHHALQTYCHALLNSAAFLYVD
jgi:Protein of unknown function (DUF1553)